MFERVAFPSLILLYIPIYYLLIIQYNISLIYDTFFS